MKTVEAKGKSEEIRMPIDRTRWVPYYTASVSLLGFVVILFSANRLTHDHLGLVAFAVMASISELMSVDLFRGKRNSSVSVSVIVAIATILVLGYPAAVFIQAVSGIITSIKKGLIRIQQKTGKATSWVQVSTFNIGMYAFTTFVAGSIYTLLGGGESVAQLTNMIPLAAAVLADVLVNLTLLIGVMALQTGLNPLIIWQQDFQWGVPINFVGGVFGGMLLALAYEKLGLSGLIVFFLPVLSIGYSFRMYVNHTKRYVSRLEEVNATLDTVNIGLLESLGAVIDAFDLYTYGHSTQVSIYARALAGAMDLPKDEQANIFKAALIHDIGKIGITEKIICKPGKLTTEEMNTIRQHPIIGADIVRRMEGLHDLVPLIRHHHERWDGTGYPAGLAGEEIPIGARIIALADAVDAMYSSRPYRETLTFEEMIAEVGSNSGVQFDPQVAQVFLSVIAQKGPEFFRNSASSIDESVNLSAIGRRVRFLKRSMVPAEPSERGEESL